MSVEVGLRPTDLGFRPALTRHPTFQLKLNVSNRTHRDHGLGVDGAEPLAKAVGSAAADLDGESFETRGLRVVVGPYSAVRECEGFRARLNQGPEGQRSPCMPVKVGLGRFRFSRSRAERIRVVDSLAYR